MRYVLNKHWRQIQPLLVMCPTFVPIWSLWKKIQVAQRFQFATQQLCYPNESLIAIFKYIEKEHFGIGSIAESLSSSRWPQVWSPTSTQMKIPDTAIVIPALPQTATTVRSWSEHCSKSVIKPRHWSLQSPKMCKSSVPQSRTLTPAHGKRALEKLPKDSKI